MNITAERTRINLSSPTVPPPLRFLSNVHTRITTVGLQYGAQNRDTAGEHRLHGGRTHGGLNWYRSLVDGLACCRLRGGKVSFTWSKYKGNASRPWQRVVTCLGSAPAFALQVCWVFVIRFADIEYLSVGMHTVQFRSTLFEFRVSPNFLCIDRYYVLFSMKRTERACIGAVPPFQHKG